MGFWGETTPVAKRLADETRQKTIESRVNYYKQMIDRTAAAGKDSVSMKIDKSCQNFCLNWLHENGFLTEVTEGTVPDNHVFIIVKWTIPEPELKGVEETSKEPESSS